MEVTVYTDASHDRTNKIAACGYCILVNGVLVKHTVYFIGEIYKIDAAEAFAVELALQYAFLMEGVTGIKVFTDHLAIITRKKERNIRYSELDTTIEIINEHNIWVRFCHVKAHNGDKYNCLVDKSCNKALKEFRRKYEGETKRWNRA